MPLWKISRNYSYEIEPNPYANKDGYFVILDAKIGEIIDQYIESGANGVNQDCDCVFDFAEIFL